MDPIGSLIGSLLFGGGVLLLYGAVKNRRVLGAEGILTTALSKGSITSISDVPEAFPSSSRDPVIGKMATRKRGPEETRDAVESIGAFDRSLANNIGAQLELVDVTSTRTDLMPLAQLLTIADAKGYTVSTSIIREYVREVTDESI